MHKERDRVDLFLILISKQKDLDMFEEYEIKKAK